MIKNSLLVLAFVCAITVTAGSARAEGLCENKVAPAKKSTMGSAFLTATPKKPEPCESKTPTDSVSSEDNEPAQQQTASEPGKNIVYFGAGVSRKTDDFDDLGDEFGDFSDNESAFTVGYLRVSNNSRLLGGVDISYEGTMLDGTYGSYSTRGAFSFNGLVGANIAKKGSFRADIAGLIGARQNTTDCPSSYLGFACYADLEPSRSYSVNYGGVLAFSFKKLTLGARVTGASTQGLVGIRF